jgi:hypothetical protein
MQVMQQATVMLFFRDLITNMARRAETSFEMPEGNPFRCGQDSSPFPPIRIAHRISHQRKCSIGNIIVKICHSVHYISGVRCSNILGFRECGAMIRRMHGQIIMPKDLESHGPGTYDKGIAPESQKAIKDF